jgi:hypothetical protein
MPLPLSTGNAGNVQTQDGQGANDDHASRHVDPLSEERGEDDRQRSSAEIERKLDGDAGHNDVDGSADGENDALQRASFRQGRVLPPPQTPKRSAFQRGWVGGRSEVTF